MWEGSGEGDGVGGCWEGASVQGQLDLNGRREWGRALVWVGDRVRG